MVEIMDIFEEVARTLRAVFPGMERVYLERIDKMHEPAMSLELISYRAPQLDPRIHRKIVDMEIVYFSKNNSVAEALAVQQSLTRAFSMGLKVKDRFIHMGELPESRLVDQILHFVVQFDYYDELKPLIATRYDHAAVYDPGNTHIDNVVEEEEVDRVKPADQDDGNGKEVDPVVRREEEIVDKLEYMEHLKINYELKG